MPESTLSILVFFFFNKSSTLVKPFSLTKKFRACCALLPLALLILVMLLGVCIAAPMLISKTEPTSSCDMILINLKFCIEVAEMASATKRRKDKQYGIDQCPAVIGMCMWHESREKTMRAQPAWYCMLLIAMAFWKYLYLFCDDDGILLLGRNKREMSRSWSR